MGFMSRSTPLTRYKVNGEIEGDFWGTVEAGIRARAFKETEGPDTVGFGWVSQGDFSDTEFQNAVIRTPPVVALSLRIDTIRIPPRSFELAVKDATKEALEQTGLQRLSSAQRRELKQRVSDKLRQKLLPTIQVYDFVWDVERSVVYLASTSRKVMEHVEGLFKEGFPGLKLTPAIPYIVAEGFVVEDSLNSITPTAAYV